MAIILDQRKNIKKTQSKKNFKRINPKGDAKRFVNEVRAAKESIEKAKTPEKVVRLKSRQNLPRCANDNTKAVLKAEPKNTNPDTNRKRVWTYKKYSSILPPPQMIRKLQRSPHAILTGKV